MKGNIIKIRDYLVDGYWRGSRLQISRYVNAEGGEVGHPEKRSVRRDWMSTFW